MGKSKMRMNKKGRWCVERENGQLRNPGRYYYTVDGTGQWPTLTALCADIGINYFSLRTANVGYPKKHKGMVIEKKENNGTTED